MPSQSSARPHLQMFVQAPQRKRSRQERVCLKVTDVSLIDPPSVGVGGLFLGGSLCESFMLLFFLTCRAGLNEHDISSINRRDISSTQEVSGSALGGGEAEGRGRNTDRHPRRRRLKLRETSSSLSFCTTPAVIG